MRQASCYYAVRERTSEERAQLLKDEWNAIAPVDMGESVLHRSLMEVFTLVQDLSKKSHTTSQSKTQKHEYFGRGALPFTGA